MTALEDAGQSQESLEQFKRMLARSEMTADEYLRLSENLRARGRYEQAELVLLKVIEDKPNSARGYALLSYICAVQNRWEESLTAAQTAKELDPEYASAYLRLGDALWGLNRLEEAADAFREFVRRNPKTVSVREGLGRVLRDLGDLDEAAKVLREALDIKPNDPSVQRTLLRIVLSRESNEPNNSANSTEDFQEGIFLTQNKVAINDAAIVEHRKTLELNPRDNWTRFKLGGSLMANGHYDEALEQFQIILNYDQGFDRAHSAMGVCYGLCGEFDAAIAAFKKAIDLEPDTAFYHYFLGGTYHHLGVGSSATGMMINPKSYSQEEIQAFDLTSLENAIEEYRNAIELAPELWLSRIGLATAMEQIGQTDEAEKIYRDVLNLELKGRAVERLAFSLRRRGRIDQSIERLRRAMEDQPQNIRHMINLGTILSYDSKIDESIATLRKILGVNPEARFAYAYMAKILASSHRLDEAHDLIAEALAKDPAVENVFQVQQVLGEILVGQGETEQGIQHLRKSIEPNVRGSNADVQCQIAMARLQQNKIAEARKECDAVLAGQPSYARGFDTLAWCDLVAYDQSGDPADLENATRNATRSSELLQQLQQESHSGIWETLGICQYRGGDLERALESLQKAATLDVYENHPRTWAFLAMSHWKLGNQEEARHWKQRLDDHLAEHDPLPILKRYSNEADRLIDE